MMSDEEMEAKKRLEWKFQGLIMKREKFPLRCMVRKSLYDKKMREWSILLIWHSLLRR